MTDVKPVDAGPRAAVRDHHSREERARASEADLVLALEAGHMGIFSFDLAIQQTRSTPTRPSVSGQA